MGSPGILDSAREHPSDTLDYLRDPAEIEAAGDMPHLLRNCVDRHDAGLDRTRAVCHSWPRGGCTTNRG
jgi:hypothetical protein